MTDTGTRPTAILLTPLLAGGAVAITLGVYARLHPPGGAGVHLAVFSSPLTAKVWLATGALLFALVQVGSAAVLYGRVPGVPPARWTGSLHRWSGRVAFLLTVPVAVHCLYVLGLQGGSPRTLIHSLAGCLFFGAFTAKMLALPRPGLPWWALPLLGGVVFTTLTALWLTSSLWFLVTAGPRI
ncbi:DUF6529 family protein [Actinoplanes sp. NPDC051851]|uniref:DUF6529 family protein n=1 Tax=Actinoplanes sp. NPDC051851 TaxID=3154753 RepID=UPI003429EC26